MITPCLFSYKDCAMLVFYINELTFCIVIDKITFKLYIYFKDKIYCVIIRILKLNF